MMMGGEKKRRAYNGSRAAYIYTYLDMLRDKKKQDDTKCPKT